MLKYLRLMRLKKIFFVIQVMNHLKNSTWGFAESF
jgi:hypothetical protein